MRGSGVRVPPGAYEKPRIYEVFSSYKEFPNTMHL